MAQLEAQAPGDFGSWWSRPPSRMPSSPQLYSDDWMGMDLPPTHPPPRHPRRGEVHRPAYSAYSAAPPSASRARPAVTRAASLLLSSPKGMRHHSSASPLMGRPPAVPFSLPRASTAPTEKRYASSPLYDDQSRPDSRRSPSHRALSPHSAQHYRSTPDRSISMRSMRSMRSTYSRSDKETEATEYTPDEEDDDPADIAYGTGDQLRGRFDPRYRSRSRSRSRPRQQQDFAAEPRYLERHRKSSQAQLQTQQAQAQQTRSRRQQNRQSSGSRDAGTRGSGSRRRQDIIYEEDSDGASERESDESEDDRTRARQPSRQRQGLGSRSASRHTTTAFDPRNPKRSQSLRRVGSMEDDSRARSVSRRPTSRRYCETDIPASYGDGPVALRRAQTQPGTNHQVPTSPSADSATSGSILGAFAGFAPPESPTQKPADCHYCVLCRREYKTALLTKLRCGHWMCVPCLKNKFKASISNPQEMPPKCCTPEQIPLKHVERHFDTLFKQTWNRKFREYAIQKRIHCPSKKCKEWIKPEDMYREDNRKVAICSRCGTKVCCVCNGKWHKASNCPGEQEHPFYFESQDGWHRCYRCKENVTPNEGDDHMVCRCGAQYCMICGEKWKTCDCTVFDCGKKGDSRSEFTRSNPFIGARAERFGSVAPPAPSTRDFRPSRGTKSVGGSVHMPPPSRDQQAFVRQRMHNQRDEDLARRMHTMPSAFGAAEERLYREDPFAEQTESYGRRHVDDDTGTTVRGRGGPRDDNRRRQSAVFPTVPQPPVPSPPPPPASLPPQPMNAMHSMRRVKYTEPSPFDPTPFDPTPSPFETAPFEPAPFEPAPFESSPYELSRYEPAQYDSSPYESTPYEGTPYESRNLAGGDYYVSSVNRQRGDGRENSLEQRLAGRFSTEHRSGTPLRGSTPQAAPAIQSMQTMQGGGGMTMGLLPPTAPPMTAIATMPPQMTPSTAPPMTSMVMSGVPPPSMGHMPMMSMVPMGSMGSMAPPMVPMPPPPGPQMEMADEYYDPMGTYDYGRRPTDRVLFPGGPGMPFADEDPEAFAYGVTTNRQRGRRDRRDGRDGWEGRDGRDKDAHLKRSVMAGLAGPDRGLGRVDEWLTYIEQGSESDAGVES